MKDSSHFYKFVRFEVGNGTSNRFWKNKLCRSSPLCTKFPLLFNMARDKEGSIDEHLIQSETPTSWNPQLTPSLNNWEMEEVADLFAELEAVEIGNGGSGDRRI